MALTTIEFMQFDPAAPFAPPQHRIGLVVRGMAAPGRDPPDSGHADCVLPSGAPVGFFADTTNAEPVGRTTVAGSSGMSFADGAAGDSGVEAALIGGALAMAYTGEVYSYATYLRERPQYVLRERAVAEASISTLLVIDVSASEAHRFERAWSSLRSDPGQFGLVGFNCSTHAGWAFAAAGLLASPSLTRGPREYSEIEGFDTPANLYRQLVVGPACMRFRSYTGYLGFEPLSHDFYRVTIDTTL